MDARARSTTRPDPSVRGAVPAVGAEPSRPAQRRWPRGDGEGADADRARQAPTSPSSLARAPTMRGGSRRDGATPSGPEPRGGAPFPSPGSAAALRHAVADHEMGRCDWPTAAHPIGVTPTQHAGAGDEMMPRRTVGQRQHYSALGPLPLRNADLNKSLKVEYMAVCLSVHSSSVT